MVRDLTEQVHEAIGLVVPERLILPRFRAGVRRTGRVPWKRIKRPLLKKTGVSYPAHRSGDVPA